MNPKHVLRSAEQFEQTANLVNQQIGMGGHHPPIAPFIVNITFSIELYLKCLIVMEKNSKPKKTHSLYTLFKEVSSASRKAITDDFNDLINSDPMTNAMKKEIPHLKTDIHSVLLGMNKAFEQWRYHSIDGMAQSSVMGTNELITAIKSRIKELDSY